MTGKAEAFIKTVYTTSEARKALHELLEPVTETEHDLVGDATNRLPTPELVRWAYHLSLVATGTGVYPVAALRED